MDRDTVRSGLDTSRILVVSMSMTQVVSGPATDIVLQCHALADQTRLNIVELLATGERCVCELTEALRTSQSRLSFHLKTLKAAGLVRDRREGRWNYYELDRVAFEQLREYLDELMAAPPRRGRSSRTCDD